MKFFRYLAIFLLLIYACAPLRTDNHQHAKKQELAQQQSDKEKEQKLQLLKEQKQKEEAAILAEENREADHIPVNFDKTKHSIHGSLLLKRTFKNQSTGSEAYSYMLLVADTQNDLMQLTVYDLNETGEPFAPQDVKNKELSQLVPYSMQENASTVYIRSYLQSTGEMEESACYMVPPPWYDPSHGLDDFLASKTDLAKTPDHIKNVFHHFSPLEMGKLMNSLQLAKTPFPQKERDYKAAPTPVLEIRQDGKRYYYNQDIPVSMLQSLAFENGEEFLVLTGSLQVHHFLNQQAAPANVSATLVESTPSHETEEPSREEIINPDQDIVTKPEQVEEDPLPTETTQPSSSHSENEEESEEITTNQNNNDSPDEEDDENTSGDDFDDWADLDF